MKKAPYIFIMPLIFLSIAFHLYAPPSVWAAEGFGDDTLVMGWSSHVGPVNAHGYGANMMFAQAFVYEPLVQYAEGGTIVPCLATSWEISPDGTVYTFHLRKDVLFSDGTPFNAAAVVKNFDAIFTRRDEHAWFTLMNLVDSYEAPDTHTVRLILTRPYAATLQELTFVRPVRFMSPAALTESGEFTKAVGTGPWVFVESRKGEYDVFKRNEHYWGTKPPIQSLVVKVIPHPEARAVALETNAVDILVSAMGDHGSAEVSPHAYAQLSNDDAYTALESAARHTRVLALHTNRHPTNDPAVRQAIVRAIDRKAILKGVLLEQELPAESLMPADVPFCDIALTPYPHNPQEAVTLLEAAGWHLSPDSAIRAKDGMPLEITLKFVANEQSMRAIGEVVQSNLRDIGIHVRLVGEEHVAFLRSQAEGSFDMIFSTSLGAPYAPFSYLTMMLVPDHADFAAQQGLKNKVALHAAIDTALSTTDEQQLRAAFSRIWRILHDEVVYVPLSRPVDKALYKKDRITDFSFGPVSYELNFATTRRP